MGFGAPGPILVLLSLSRRPWGLSSPLHAAHIMTRLFMSSPGQSQSSLVHPCSPGPIPAFFGGPCPSPTDPSPFEVVVVPAHCDSPMLPNDVPTFLDPSLIVSTALPSARLSSRRHESPVVGTALSLSPGLCLPFQICAVLARTYSLYLGLNMPRPSLAGLSYRQ